MNRTTRITVLDWRKRHRCQACGARSTGHSVAGTMTATVAGWRCARCLSVETCNSQAQQLEPAPGGSDETPVASPLPSEERAA